jgi:8-oxo-dGTP pyrophosphatase MutT (NUDIX family)
MTFDVPVRPAATVVLLDDATGALKVFMVRRHHAVAFMAGAHVFPGGRVDPGDRDVQSCWCDLPYEADDPGRPNHAVRAAAVRELFEEAGILIARDDAGDIVAIDEHPVRSRFDTYRSDVHENRVSLRKVAVRERLRLALDALIPFARWITPPTELRRFDTWFFVARMPPRQHAAHESIEATDSFWIAPADALAAARRGDMLLPPPTWVTLQSLAAFTSVDEVLHWASTVAIEGRQPSVVKESDGTHMLLPGDALTRFVLQDGRWCPEPPA